MVRMSRDLRQFHIHGDNVVECERTLRLIQAVLAETYSYVIGPIGSPVCPSFDFRKSQEPGTLRFTLFPGFGRWHQDILQLIRARGGTLREAADAVLTDASSGQEEPLVALEYCGALPAGNQAWQRNGRAYSFGLAGVPYLYIAEIGGYELGVTRERKAPRLPNAAVPFSYLSFSASNKTPIVPVFVASPGADTQSRDYYASVIGESEITDLLRALVLDEDPQATLEALKRKVLNFVRLRASSARPGRTLTPDQWSQAYNTIEAGGLLVSYLLEKTKLEWSKTAYIESLTSSFRQLIIVASRLAIGLTSSELPMCLIPADRRSKFAQQVQEIYPRLPRDFVAWLSSEGPLAVCWVMGFKPRGDDARPDRGLPPMARMLVGPDVDLLTVVYGPAPPAHWLMLKEDPPLLVQRSGIWEAILVASTAVLVDSATDHVTDHGFLSSHWANLTERMEPMSLLVSPPPVRFGENDVDTLVHMLFALLGGGLVFEGMCNPPGGDWSGISLQTPDRSTELRWLSLPRVSGEHTKRPDHVLQIFGLAGTPVILAIESKEMATSVEGQIGPRLKAYVSELLTSSASIERPTGSPAQWNHSDKRLSPQEFLLASAIAFLYTGNSNLEEVRARAQADLLMAFEFDPDGTSCQIHLVAGTGIGRALMEFAAKIPLGNVGLSIRED